MGGGGYDEDKRPREGEVEGLKKGLQKRSPHSLFYLWNLDTIVVSGVPISGLAFSLPEKDDYHLLSEPGSEAQDGWPVVAVIFPRRRGGNILLPWLSLPCSCLHSLATL